MSRLRSAVVGVGYLGRFHAQKYKQIDDVELIGVHDADAGRAETVAAELGVKPIAALNDLAGQVDLVTVASSTSSHFEVCEYLLGQGIHVHVEKPMTTTSDEARKLCDLASRKKLKFQVGHVERFNPALQAAREKIARPLFIECHRLAPFKPRGVDVDVVLDLMIHDLDMILHLVGSEPVNVSAVGTPVLTSSVDIANARIEFSSGAVANVTSSRVSQQAQRRFRVFQESQYLSLDFGAGEVKLLTKTGPWQMDAPPPLEQQSWNLEKGDALLAETKSFVDAVKHDRPVVVTGEDGLRALSLAEKIIACIASRNR